MHSCEIAKVAMCGRLICNFVRPRSSRLDPAVPLHWRQAQQRAVMLQQILLEKTRDSLQRRSCPNTRSSCWSATRITNKDPVVCIACTPSSCSNAAKLQEIKIRCRCSDRDAESACPQEGSGADHDLTEGQSSYVGFEDQRQTRVRAQSNSV